ncbi:MAG TPA: glycosyltransferase [Vicinamibacterales bacterium]|nr:glycosyltransferase [Vicinamibacterales bacterium]
MRIFVAVRHALDPRRFYGGLWSGHFYPALRQLGHELVESQTDLYPTSRFMDVASGFTPEERAARTAATEAILDEVRQAHRRQPLQLFLSYFYNAHFDPQGFDQLRALRIPSINFYCNSIYQFENVADIAAKADVSWYPERDARASYERVGARAVRVQMGADPSIYRPTGVPREPRACFAGQNYADRAVWMAALVNAGVPVDVYGHGWGAPTAEDDASTAETDPPVYLGRRQFRGRSVGGYLKVTREIIERDGAIAGARRIARRLLTRHVHDAAVAAVAPYAKGPAPAGPLVDVFNRYEVCLNLSNVWADGHPGAALIPHVRLRDFEAPMCRACYLTGYTDEITEHYDIGTEIDAYRTPDEFVDKTRYYLAHPAAAESLRQAGYRRAVNAHTWVHRFTELFTKTGLATA